MASLCRSPGQLLLNKVGYPCSEVRLEIIRMLKTSLDFSSSRIHHQDQTDLIPVYVGAVPHTENQSRRCCSSYSAHMRK